jgi:hypothetical protein
MNVLNLIKLGNLKIIRKKKTKNTPKNKLQGINLTGIFLFLIKLNKIKLLKILSLKNISFSKKKIKE